MSHVIKFFVPPRSSVYTWAQGSSYNANLENRFLPIRTSFVMATIDFDISKEQIKHIDHVFILGY
jgi:hypothetical protein